MNNIFLKEGADFTWQEVGDVRDGVPVRDYCPLLKSTGQIMPRVISPKLNRIVYAGGDENIHACPYRLRPVLILDGNYMLNGEVNNFWRYQYINEDLSLGRIVHNIGIFFKSPFSFDVRVNYEIILEEQNIRAPGILSWKK